MPRVDFGALASLQARWENNQQIPRWRREIIVALMGTLRKRIADNGNNLEGVQLYYPDDCLDHDAFMMVAHALDALIVPTSNGYVARDFGKCIETG